MIKTEYIDSSNYEVLSFSLRLLTSSSLFNIKYILKLSLITSD